MCKDRLIVAVAVLLTFSGYLFSQEKAVIPAEIAAGKILAGRNELVIRFKKPSDIRLEKLSEVLSIDGYRNDTITAYLNADDFNNFLSLQIRYEIVPPPSMQLQIGRNATTDIVSAYPSYTQYINTMRKFAADFPDVCRLTEFGTSVGGRKLLALKISNHPDTREEEPVVFLSAAIHGDEPLGYVLMLKLIDTILVNRQLTFVRNIIDHAEIWINPLANPDGAYYQSDSSIFGSRRFNKNGVDLNRDFPDVRNNQNSPDGRQKETQCMMQFMETIRPALSVNFHTGAEVVNYPWDTWPENHPDSLWFRHLSAKYADTAHKYSSPGYMEFLNNGITKGYDWYPVFGGRQDYINYFLQGREVTIELSDIKIPDAGLIDQFWHYNWHSMMQYLENTFIGIHGVVTDSINGNPVKASVFVEGHDTDTSEIFSSPINGYYCRLLDPGTYTISVEAAGYKRRTYTVEAGNNYLSRHDVRLCPENRGVIYPNPFHQVLYFNIPSSGSDMHIKIVDMNGRVVTEFVKPVHYPGKQEIPVPLLASGTYIIHISCQGLEWKFKIVR